MRLNFRSFYARASYLERSSVFRLSIQGETHNPSMWYSKTFHLKQINLASFCTHLQIEKNKARQELIKPIN